MSEADILSDVVILSEAKNLNIFVLANLLSNS